MISAIVDSIGVALLEAATVISGILGKREVFTPCMLAIVDEVIE